MVQVAYSLKMAGPSTHNGMIRQYIIIIGVLKKVTMTP